MKTDKQCLKIISGIGATARDEYGSDYCQGMPSIALWLEENRFKDGKFNDGFSVHIFHATTKNLALNAAAFFCETGDWE